MTKTRKHYEARWSVHIENNGRYEIMDRPWISRDGYEWLDKRTSKLVDTEEFDNAAITLIGGPQDGEVMS